jgi:hypothetical protein
MLISRDYRLIFIHLQKTAGTSIAEFMTSNLGATRDGRKHEYAYEAKSRIPEEIWQNCFRFSFVRNPWDRLASWYQHIRRNYTKPGDNPFFDYLMSTGDSFEDFILHGDRTISTPWGERNLFTSQFENLSSDDRLLVDFVGRFESLASDWKLVLDRIGYSGRAALPHVNANPRKHYRELYTEKMRLTVEEKCHKDIEEFGYRF